MHGQQFADTFLLHKDVVLATALHNTTTLPLLTPTFEINAPLPYCSKIIYIQRNMAHKKYYGYKPQFEY